MSTTNEDHSLDSDTNCISIGPQRDGRMHPWLSNCLWLLSPQTSHFVGPDPASVLFLVVNVIAADAAVHKSDSRKVGRKEGNPDITNGFYAI